MKHTEIAQTGSMPTPVSAAGPCHLCGRGEHAPMYCTVYEQWFLVLRTEGCLVGHAESDAATPQLPLPVITPAKVKAPRPPKRDSAGGYYDARGRYVPPPPTLAPAGNYFPRPLCYACTRRAVLFLRANGEHIPGYEWCLDAEATDPSAARADLSTVRAT